MYEVKQSSTTRALLFQLISSSDHITGATGVTPTVTLSKNGASFASPSGAVSEVGSGWYKVAGNATDSGTLGPLALHATGSGCDPCDALFQVVAYDPDASYLGMAFPTNFSAQAIGSDGSVSLNINDSLLINAGSVQSGSAASITTLTGPTSADLVGCTLKVWNTSTGNWQVRGIVSYSAGSIGVDRNWTTAVTNSYKYAIYACRAATLDSNGYVRVQQGTQSGQLNASGGVVPANMTQILGAAVDGTGATAQLGVNVVTSTPTVSANLVSCSAGAINGAAFTLDTGLTKIQSGVAGSGSTSGTFKLDSASGAGDVYTGNWLLVNSSGTIQEKLITAASSTTLTVDSNWVVTPSAGDAYVVLPRAKTYGVFSNVKATDTSGAALATHSDATTIAGYTSPLASMITANVFTSAALANAPTGSGGGGGITQAQVRAAVWDNAASGNNSAGTMGAIMNQLSTYDPLATTSLSAYPSGSAGKALSNLDATISSRSTYAGGDTSGTTALLARVPDTISLANIGTQTVTSIAAATSVEPTGVPSANDTIFNKISWLFSLFTNKRITTANNDRLRNATDTADMGTAQLTDVGGVFTRTRYL